jgi:hypothetical protein
MESQYRERWGVLESAKDAAAAAEVQRIANAQQGQVAQLQAELHRTQTIAAQNEAEYNQRCVEFQTATNPAASQPHALVPTPKNGEMTDRDEIQRAIGNLGKRIRTSDHTQDDQTRFGVRGADGELLVVPAYVGNAEVDDERSTMSTINGDLSQADSFAGSTARIVHFSWSQGQGGDLPQSLLDLGDEIAQAMNEIGNKEY